MKGKYPKVIRTEQPVSIDVGKARPRTSGFRRLNPEEQALVNEYVEKLIAADVVENLQRTLVQSHPTRAQEGRWIAGCG